MFSSLLSQEEKVSLWVPKTPATSHHHHHRERRPQPHLCKKQLPTKQLQPRARQMWICSMWCHEEGSSTYVTKYAIKSEPHSKCLKTVYSTIMKSLKDDDKYLKVVQKILINSIGERDYSAQTTCATCFFNFPCTMHHETLSF